MKVYNYNGTGDFDPQKQYEWRLKWLEQQIKKRESRGEKFSTAQIKNWEKNEKDLYNNQVRDYDKINKLQKDLAIIVPTHFYQCVWLKACLESCKKTGYFTLISYDNPFFDKNHKVEQRMPSSHTIMLADSLIMKPKTWGGGVGVPHSWNMYFGLNFLKSLGFKYVFNINGDCIMEKPEGIETIREMLGDADAIACEFEEGRYFGTMSWLSKLDLMATMWDENFQRMFQYNFGNAEARMGIFAKRLGAKIVPVENPEDHHFKPPGVKGTWRKVLGFRHLHAEHKVRRALKMEPVEERYFDRGPNDQFLNSLERNSIAKYWKDSDKSHLELWWGNRGCGGCGKKR
jgi:hypothetical protein